MFRRRKPARTGLVVVGALLVLGVLYYGSHSGGDTNGQPHALAPSPPSPPPPPPPPPPPAQQQQQEGGKRAWRRGVAVNAEVATAFVALKRADPLPLVAPTAEHLHGRLGLRADGTAGWTPLAPLDQATETAEEKRVHHNPHCFNLRMSDGIPLYREVPDVRHHGCRGRAWPAVLPTTSVVFVFFNEPLSPLLRSIHSVLDRTPPALLVEIILVDDGSDAPWLQQELEDYLALLPKVKLVRRPVRLGLMATREYGASVATGDTITFLDAHIECNYGWLEPMLARVAEDPKHVVMPVIDSIDPDSWEYRQGGLDILGFSWSLGQKGLPSRRRSGTEPMRSPVMAGGLFTMDRKLFFDLGGYDPEMRLYGGEEMEISFRIWQCGGTLECIPCSHVGHVFRTGKYWQGQVYPVPGEVIVKNKLRAAEVWMDEYKEIAKSVMSKLPAGMELGPLDSMLAIRRRFQCRPFKWFLENVYPELFIPNDPAMVRFRGEVRNPHTDGCLDTLGALRPGQPIGAYPCHHNHGTQEFLFSHKGELRVAAMDFDTCVDIGNSNNQPKVYPCHGTGGNQQWAWDEATGQLRQGTTGPCLAAARKQTAMSPLELTLEACDAARPGQRWDFHK